MSRFFAISLFVPLLFASCSTTSNIPEDDQLFIGLNTIKYEAYEKSQHFFDTQEEIEAALATEPNGALFGSSYYRSPLPIGLWVWNATTGSNSVVKKWINKTFATEPVLMSQVNPALRAAVARSVLRKNGYLHGSVSYETITQKNPRKAKIAYTVRLDSLFRIDSMAYVGFPPQMQRLIDSTAAEAYLYSGAPFSVENLDAERTRLSQLLRNNGFYYYQPGMASFLADTFDIPNRAQLRLQLADSLPEQALQQWRIGRMSMQLRRTTREKADTAIGTYMTIEFSGKRPPLRPAVILRNMKMRPPQLFSNANYQESIQKINATSIFSSVDLQLTPRQQDTTKTTGLFSRYPYVLDQQLVCTLDKPYDFYIETNFINRTIGRMGPELKVGLTRRNALRGGERLNLNLHGSYEWQTNGSGENMNSYQYGVDVSIEFPRTLFPKIIKKKRAYQRFRSSSATTTSSTSVTDSLARQRLLRRAPRPQFFATPWTIAKVSSDVVRRPKYYKMHIVSAEWTYRWQKTATSRHEFSPLTLKYQFMNNHTLQFDSLVGQNPYLTVSMEDYFIPKMRYTYSYSSPSGERNPIRWDATVEQAGNITALFDVMVQGNGWQQRNKTLFKNAYSQFIRFETDFTKNWRLNSKTHLVGHVSAGIIYSYGNSTEAPFSESFYAGGANSVRAFTVRSIGPGAFPGMDDQKFSYLMQNGEMKFVANLELRRPVFGNLHGAVFLDVGNIWNLKDKTVDSDGTEEGDRSKLFYDNLYKDTGFRPRNFLRQLATGTGVGLRYDLDFLVIRVDWGFGLHLPYDTGKSGYFNIPRFKDMHSLHLAVGYPF